MIQTYMFQQRSDPNSDLSWSPREHIRVRRTRIDKKFDYQEVPNWSDIKI